MSEIKDVIKAKNAKIFPNSIVIKIQGNLQLFLTSFLSRDYCYGLILQQLRKTIQHQEDSSSLDLSQKLEPEPSDPSKKESVREVFPEIQEKQRPQTLEEKPISPKIEIAPQGLWDEARAYNSSFTQPMIQIEKERLGKVEAEIPRFDQPFPWVVLSIKIPNMPLKHVVSSACYDHKKFECLNQQSLMSYMYTKLESTELNYSQISELNEP